MPPRSSHLRRAAGLFTVAASCALAATAAAHQPPRPDLTGHYRLVLTDQGEQVNFGLLVRDSAGRLVGRFLGGGGTTRPLLDVRAQPESAQMTVTYRDASGVALMRLRFRGDSVRGDAQYEDGTFPVYGVRGPLPPMTPEPPPRRPR